MQILRSVEPERLEGAIADKRDYTPSQCLGCETCDGPCIAILEAMYVPDLVLKTCPK